MQQVLLRNFFAHTLLHVHLRYQFWKKNHIRKIILASRVLVDKKKQRLVLCINSIYAQTFLKTSRIIVIILINVFQLLSLYQRRGWFFILQWTRRYCVLAQFSIVKLKPHIIKILTLMLGQAFYSFTDNDQLIAFTILSIFKF